MASSLVDNMSADFSPDKFSDEYQDQLRAADRREAGEGRRAGHCGDLR